MNNFNWRRGLYLVVFAILFCGAVSAALLSLTCFFAGLWLWGSICAVVTLLMFFIFGSIL